jgi:hypothetical protein
MTSRGWYVVAALLFIAGGVGAGWTLWGGISDIGTSIVRITVPGSGELTLDKPGNYTIYHERNGVTDGHVSAVESLAGMTVTVTNEATGAKLAVKTPSFTGSYTVNGHSGVSVLAFDVPQSGRYRLVGAYDDGRANPKTVLAVNLGLFGRMFRMITMAFFVGGVGALSALVLVLVTFFQRRRVFRAGATIRVS